MFEWNDLKNKSNLSKHGVSFEEAAVAFADPLGLDGPDVLHSHTEIRNIRIADPGDGTLLTIIYTIRIETNGTQKIRIISARKASRKERLAYQAAP
jgi:uncharacterized DUF497 family protein